MKYKYKCFRCGKDWHKRTSIREWRPELCTDCLNYIYNFKCIPVLSVNKERIK